MIGHRHTGQDEMSIRRLLITKTLYEVDAYEGTSGVDEMTEQKWTA